MSVRVRVAVVIAPVLGFRFKAKNEGLCYYRIGARVSDSISFRI